MIIANKVKIFYYDIRNFMRNLPHFLKLAWKWHWFDYYYTLGVFCDNLRRMGDKIEKQGNSVLSKRTGRRAKIAANMLDRAYNGNKTTDKSLCNYLTNHSNMIRDLRGTDIAESKYNREYSDKLFKVIVKRLDESEKRRKEEAWAYLVKYIEHFWD